MLCNSTPLAVDLAFSRIQPVVVQGLVLDTFDIALSHIEQKYLFLGWNT